MLSYLLLISLLFLAFIVFCHHPYNLIDIFYYVTLFRQGNVDVNICYVIDGYANMRTLGIKVKESQLFLTNHERINLQHPHYFNHLVKIVTH
jgi:hypothetical protein